MPYREWLRLQEIDWHESRSPLVGSESTPAPVPTAAQLTASATPPLRFSHARRVARPILAGAAIVGAWGWTQRVKAPPASTAAPVATSAQWAVTAHAETRFPPAPELTPEPSGARSPAAAAMTATAPPAPAPVPPPAPLATVLDRRAPEGMVVVVRATPAHSFSRSAPADDSFLCLKLTDETDASVTTRAYLPLSTQSPAFGPAALPWGRDQRVAVRLRWQDHDPATGVAGHWQVATLDAAAPSLSSVR